MEKRGFFEGISGVNLRKGQVTIFIIIAILIVGFLTLFFIFKDKIINPVGTSVPPEFEPAYNSFLSCIENSALRGIGFMESQGGYIYTPEFELGSTFMPFSSQLDLFGTPIPYWYYVSGNNLQKEQVPSKENLQSDLERYIDENIKNCNLDNFASEGFRIILGEPNTKVTINDRTVFVNLDMSMNMKYKEQSIFVNKHAQTIQSNLGELYNSAKKIYDYEQKNLFLENYTVDVLRLYAPVDGVEISCSPKVWNARDVFKNLSEALVANTLALKVRNGDFKLLNKNEKYFVLDLDVNGNVQFLTSENWPSTFQVSPSDGSMMISKPVGVQQGLGILGFCFVPYHYVYDVKYPVLVQISEGDEIFQFPLAVVVNGNKPRKAFDVGTQGVSDSAICGNRNTPFKIYTYDSKLNSISAQVSLECLGVKCDLGKTENGVLSTTVPQCVNGFISTSADGYEDARYQISTTIESRADVLMNKIYPQNINLLLDGVPYKGNALISFSSENFSKSVAYPEQTTVDLTEGQYEIQVFIYKNSELKFEGSTSQQCVKVPQEGIGGMFGLEKEKCFDIEVPEQIVTSVLAGGGKQNYYILESNLALTKSVDISATSLPVPTDLKSLETNYLLFENRELGINFK